MTITDTTPPFGPPTAPRSRRTAPGRARARSSWSTLRCRPTTDRRSCQRRSPAASAWSATTAADADRSGDAHADSADPARRGRGHRRAHRCGRWPGSAVRHVVGRRARARGRGPPGRSRHRSHRLRAALHLRRLATTARGRPSRPGRSIRRRRRSIGRREGLLRRSDRGARASPWQSCGCCRCGAERRPSPTPCATTSPCSKAPSGAGRCPSSGGPGSPPRPS